MAMFHGPQALPRRFFKNFERISEKSTANKEVGLGGLMDSAEYQRVAEKSGGAVFTSAPTTVAAVMG